MVVWFRRERRRRYDGSKASGLVPDQRPTAAFSLTTKTVSLAVVFELNLWIYIQNVCFFTKLMQYKHFKYII